MKVGALVEWFRVSTLKREVPITLNLDYLVFLHFYISIYSDLVLVRKLTHSIYITNKHDI